MGISEQANAIEPGSTVIITGAGGFIGGRLAERLVSEHGAKVRCIVRDKASAGRLAKLPVEIIEADLADAAAIDKAVAGASYVFHCAYDGRSRAQNIDGTKNLIEASLKHGVKRFVYVSTVSVYEPLPDGPLSEETRDGDRSWVYARNKLDLEKMVFAAVKERGLAGTIVQPTIVYGPYSKPWTNAPAEMLLYGKVILPDEGEGLCNAVYIDDLIDGFLLAATKPEAIGQRFLLSGPSPVTWREFFGAFAIALGTVQPSYWPKEEIVKQNGSSGRDIKALLTNPKRILQMIVRWGPARRVLEAGLDMMPKKIKDTIAAKYFGAGGKPKLGQVFVPQKQTLALYSARASVDNGKAMKLLGYAPKFDFAAGMNATRQYLEETFGAVREEIRRDRDGTAEAPSEAKRSSGGIGQSFKRVSWTMVDQGLVSVGNFVLNVTLARHLAPEDYGTFALIFGGFLALQLVNASLLSYPLSIRLPTAPQADHPRLVATNFVLALAACIPLGVVLATVLAVFERTDLAVPALAAFVLLQSQEILRRCLLSNFQHKTATIGDAVTYLGQAATVVLLTYFGGLTLTSAFFAMAVTFGLGAVIQAWQLNLKVGAAGRFVETFKDYWSTGAYALANNLVSILRLQILPWSLAATAGPAAAAAFQAALNVINLANPIILGLCNIIPQAAASARPDGNGRAWRSARNYALFGAPVALGFYALVFAVPGLFLQVFYGASSPYLELTTVVRIMILAWVAGYMTDMICSYLHGIDAARSAFDINTLGTVTTAVIALPLIAYWGITGAAIAIVIANAVRLVASNHLLTRTIADERAA